MGARVDEVDSDERDDGAAELMRAHPWPGNARELDNAMQRAMILATGGVIRAETLRLCLGSAAPRPGRRRRVPRPARAAGAGLRPLAARTAAF